MSRGDTNDEVVDIRVTYHMPQNRASDTNTCVILNIIHGVSTKHGHLAPINSCIQFQGKNTQLC